MSRNPFLLLILRMFLLPFLLLFPLLLQGQKKLPHKRGPPVLQGRQQKRGNTSDPLVVVAAVGGGGGGGGEEKNDNNKEPNVKGEEPVIRSGLCK